MVGHLYGLLWWKSACLSLSHMGCMPLSFKKLLEPLVAGGLPPLGAPACRPRRSNVAFNAGEALNGDHLVHQLAELRRRRMWMMGYGRPESSTLLAPTSSKP